MIRVRKPVKVLEWGDGTNTTNQIWTVAGEGRIDSFEMRNGRTTLVIDLNAPYQKKNDKDNIVKIAQEGEGMTMNSPRWGEVAMGHIKTVENSGRRLHVEIPTATKIDKRKHD